MMQISIMQGRLLPPFEGRFQAFPAQNWEKEFYLGQKIGLYSIEWIYEDPHWEVNPLSSDEGILHLKKLIEDTKVQVRSICADYYMTNPLIKNGQAQDDNVEHLTWLLQQAKKLDITYIVLPFVDSSSLGGHENQEALIDLLRRIMKIAAPLGIEIHLETDLSPLAFTRIFEEVNHPLLKLNYDIGNSASLGYHVDDEMTQFGKYLGSVHVKDRILGGGTVPLGTGNADLPKCFGWFHKLGFNRWYVLQAARGDAEQEEAHISMILNTTKELINGTWIKK